MEGGLRGAERPGLAIRTPLVSPPFRERDGTAGRGRYGGGKGVAAILSRGGREERAAGVGGQYVLWGDGVGRGFSGWPQIICFTGTSLGTNSRRAAGKGSAGR